MQTSASVGHPPQWFLETAISNYMESLSLVQRAGWSCDEIIVRCKESDQYRDIFHLYAAIKGMGAPFVKAVSTFESANRELRQAFERKSNELQKQKRWEEYEEELIKLIKETGEKRKPVQARVENRFYSQLLGNMDTPANREVFEKYARLFYFYSSSGDVIYDEEQFFPSPDEKDLYMKGTMFVRKKEAAGYRGYRDVIAQLKDEAARQHLHIKITWIKG